MGSPPLPLPSPDHGFESDQRSPSTSSSVSSSSNSSGGSRHSHHGSWCHRESRTNMKINLPVFKDEDTKYAITYQSWHWDLMVYHHTGCQDHTLLPCAICSLQGYPGASFPECFPPGHIAKLKCDCFYGGLPKWLKAMVAYLKANANEKTYSDYLQAVNVTEKEEAMEPSPKPGCWQ